MKNGSRVGHADEDEKGSRKMTERDRQALLRVRSQARLVRELSERLEDAEAAAIPGRQMDGMPRGKGGMPRGLEMKLMLKECFICYLVKLIRLLQAFVLYITMLKIFLLKQQM